jgi:hypothetical protein
MDDVLIEPVLHRTIERRGPKQNRLVVTGAAMFYAAKCSRCGTVGPEAPDADAARTAAVKHHWAADDDGLLCGECLDHVEGDESDESGGGDDEADEGHDKAPGDGVAVESVGEHQAAAHQRKQRKAGARAGHKKGHHGKAP